MALSADTPRATREYQGDSALIAPSEVLYHGSYLAGLTEDYATSGDRGYVDVVAGAKGELPLGGFAERGATGEATPVSEISYRQDPYILRRVTVTGASSQAKVYQPVYMSDDGTLTLTRPTRGLAIGLVVRYHSGSIVDVLLFGLPSIAALSLAGAGKQNWMIGVFNFATAADADIITGWPIPQHVEIVDFFGIVAQPFVGSGGTIALNLEIGTTDVTGGVLTASTAAAGVLGAKVSATAITAANVAHEGDTLSVEGASTGGTTTSGLMALYITVKNRIGL